MDNISPARRSENMRRIRSKNTKPELIVRSLVHRMGYRFRLHNKNLPGCPDLVFPRLKKVIFVHGCFWHQHRGCADGRMPKSRESYWAAKFLGNHTRDKKTRAELRRRGWGNLTIWDCETANSQKIESRLRKFLSS